MIQWTSGDTFSLAGTDYVCDQYGVRVGQEADRFCIAKVPVTLDRIAQFLATLAPRVVVEVGILEGASTALIADLVQPDLLIAIEHSEAPTAKLREFIKRRGYEDRLKVYGGVDQADTARLQSILDGELGDRLVDLVVDDASHRYEPTLRSFGCLFPRLRAGGVYLLEDWATGLREGGVTLQAGERPLVDLVFDCITAKGRHPGLIADVTVHGGWSVIERGPLPITAPFDSSVWFGGADGGSRRA